MIASRQEASDLLGKWFKERTPITAFFTAVGSPFSAKVSGFVNGISSNIVISDGTHTPTVTVRPQNYMLVPIGDALEYQYVEAKDIGLTQDELAFVTDVKGAASLSIVLPNGARLSLFERR
ncbi:MAG TPA: hypothetical protein VI386_04265 [Candidatus Sulfotelmatobacter sp.]